MNYLLLILIIIVISIIGIGVWRDNQVIKSPNGQIFSKGIIPEPKPNGLLKGTVTGLKTDWQGKEFDASKDSGINIFDKNGIQTKSFPFKTYTGEALDGSRQSVLKIDYNLSVNPLWARFIVDELVQTSPDHYLGRLNFKIGPIGLAVGYFTLQKP